MLHTFGCAPFLEIFMDLPKRKTNRLKGYDYSQNGGYFITICTHSKKHILSSISRDSPCGCPCIKLTSLGKIVEETILDIQNNPNITVDKYVIMPNHIHLLLIVHKDESGSERTAARAVPTISDIIGALKSKTSVKWLKTCKANNTQSGAIWQRSFYDHIIRGERDYEEIWQYIDENPLRWDLDCFY